MTKRSFVGVGGHVAETAGVAGIESDESLFSPRGSPGVLDPPAAGADTDEEDTVVESGGAVVEDSRAVSAPIGGIDGDGDGSGGDGGGQGVAVSDVSEARDLEGSGLGGAGLLDGLVGVLALVNDTVVSDEFEGAVHQSSVAGHVSVGARAVDELLFGEALEAAVGQLAEALEGAGGGEGPARAALSLVLDGGDGALGDPVDVAFQDDVLLVFEHGFFGGDQTQVHGDELLVGDSGELVDAHFVGVVGLGVVELDLGKVLKEHSLSVGLFEHRLVLHSEFRLPGFEGRELGLGFVLGVHHRHGAQNSEENCKYFSAHLQFLQYPLLTHGGFIVTNYPSLTKKKTQISPCELEPIPLQAFIFLQKWPAQGVYIIVCDCFLIFNFFTDNSPCN